MSSRWLRDTLQEKQFARTPGFDNTQSIFDQISADINIPRNLYFQFSLAHEPLHSFRNSPRRHRKTNRNLYAKLRCLDFTAKCTGGVIARFKRGSEESDTNHIASSTRQHYFSAKSFRCNFSSCKREGHFPARSGTGSNRRCKSAANRWNDFFAKRQMISQSLCLSLYFLLLCIIVICHSLPFYSFVP